MSLLSLFGFGRRSSPAAGSGRSKSAKPASLRLEHLEDRTMPAMLFVTPFGQPGFRTLQAAVNAAANGDIIQIEPGSSPTNFSATNWTTTVNLSTLTIRGDPSASLMELPTIQGNPGASPAQPALVIGPSATGIVLDHLTIRGGTGFNGTGVGVLLSAGSHGTVIRNSVVDGLAEVGGASGNGSNTLFNDYFTGPIVLKGNSPSLITSDQVLDNHFSKDQSGGTSLAGTLVLVNDTGALVQGNTFDSGSSTAPLFVGASGTAGSPVVVYDNHVVTNFTAAIQVSTTDNANANGAATFVQLLDNYAQSTPFTGTGSGIQITKASAAQNLAVKIAGNDLRANNFGLSVQGDGTSTGIGTIDAGGGALGSLGGNDFRGFTAPAGPNGAAIRMSNVFNAPIGPGNTLVAHSNIFTSGVNPGSVVLDNSHGTGGTGLIDVTALDDNHAFVQTVYEDVLHRSGNPAPGSELDGWAGQGAANIVHGINSSHEAHLYLAAELYIHILARQGMPTEIATLAGGLDTGGTMEQAMANLFGSSEFLDRSRSIARNGTSPDQDTPSANYIQALYFTLLGRQATPAERAAWQPVLGSTSRTSVAMSFLNSEEFRSDATALLYGYSPYSTPANGNTPNINVITPFLEPNLLHRVFLPTPSEIENWLTSGLPLAAIEESIMGGSEFFANG
jgi:hypothetical protein